jgi:hypothetical protein
MGVNDAIRAYNGLINYLNNKVDVGKPKKRTHRAYDEYLNNILIKFGKDHNITMAKNNSPRYKGSYSPVMSNARRVQANWSDFVKWLDIHYKK